MKPVVAVIGRPNVGKSTFFNAVTRTKDALVDDFPGVTRDRHYGDASHEGVNFTLVDTGGFSGKDEAFSEEIRAQIFQAMEDADAVILMLDGKSGVTPFDSDMVEILRSFVKPVFYVINKIDGQGQENRHYEFYSLGVETLYSLSAEHRYGISDFLDELVKVLKPSETLAEAAMIKIAVVGRPNVGKSSLINRILGENRHIVSDVPGTTRDAIDSVCTVGDRKYLIIDTAGIRRKGRVSEKIEKFSIIKALRSLDRCDIALIVLDANEGITEQDASIAGYAFERGCGCILLLNKWDLLEKEKNTLKTYQEELRMATKFLSFAPILSISALTGQRVVKIFNEVNEVSEQYNAQIGTGKLNQMMNRATERTAAPMHHGQRIKFFYSTQIATKPPTFISFVNYPDAVHFSYKRYLINQIREEAGLGKTPIRLFFRSRSSEKKGG
ncbi:MAG: ribosome biogenesis GTPase Der [Desulfobacteraceae bacterium]|nr:ribosome biogenesis GTPase Der [Desulfobacteraceae bacterium]MBU4052833.1 ribosome biogenesis GTPase Der [Pseudomonadota bacterium]